MAASLGAGSAARRVWAEPDPGPRLWVFLDAEFYLDAVDAPGAMARLREEGGAADVRCVFVSHGGAAARHADFACSPDYLRFLVARVLPWGGAGGQRGHGIVGLSLSGLASAFAGVERPDVFPAAVCQSPSAWWNDEWLAGHVAGRTLKGSRLWTSVGAAETETDVRHPPSGMHQRTSQRDSVGRLAEVLRSAGAEVHATVFPGGHDTACWAAELPDALRWMERMAEPRRG